MFAKLLFEFLYKICILPETCINKPNIPQTEKRIKTSHLSFSGAIRDKAGSRIVNNKDQGGG